MNDEKTTRIPGMTDGTLARRPRRGSGRAPGEKELDDRVQTHIGNQLKIMYDSIVNEAVPEALLDLLRQVDGASDKKISDEADKKR